MNKWQLNITEEEKRELDTYSVNEQEQIFSSKLSFGTGGVRAKMGIGPSVLNVYTISQITKAYIKYLKNIYSGEIRIVLGRDSRNNGKVFADVVTNTLEENGIQVYSFDDIIPTPVVSYMVRKEQAQGAIILTASHNPKEYNGYKVYNDTGAQLNLDEANCLIQYVNAEPVDFTLSKNSKSPSKIFSTEDLNEYIGDISTSYENKDNNLKIVFTPIHGTTYKLLPKVLKQNGYKNIIEVNEQMKPDGNFPTTVSANPEEKEAFNYAEKYLVENNADIAIATDPDGDRIGLVSYEHGKLISLSGNETGALLITYLIETNQYKANSIIYKTIVTGDLGKEIATSNNIEVYETLTGFKFIGEQIELQKDKHFLFGYEESYGYLFNPKVRDKDSIQSALFIADMVSYFKKQQLSLTDKLKQIKAEFGYYEEQTFAYTVTDNQHIKNIMSYARSQTSDLLGYKIKNKIDYLHQETGLPYADVVKFYFDNMWIVFRPSGTEPKIKMYVSIKTESETASSHKMEYIKQSIDQLVKSQQLSDK